MRTLLILAAIGTMSFGCGALVKTPATATKAQVTERQQRMLKLLDYCQELLEMRYAPADFKRRRFGWTASRAAEQVRLRIRTSKEMRTAEYRHLLRRLFRSPRDIHTSLVLSGNKAVWLGIHIRKTPQGYRLAWVDRQVLPAQDFPFQPGDEVVRFDGASLDQAIATVAASTEWRSTAGFEQRFAEWFLVSRADSEWHSIPAVGSIATIELRPRGGGPAKSVEIPWLDSQRKRPTSRPHFWARAGTYVPALGKTIWLDDGGPFPCRIFTADGRRYGRVRVDNYKHGLAARREGLAQFDRCIAAFNQHKVSALVWDQINNGGGNYLWGFALLSRLIDKPLRPTLQHHMIDHTGHVAGFGRRAFWKSMLASLDAATDEQSAARLMTANPMLSSRLEYLLPTLATVVDLRGWLTGLFDARRPAKGRALAPPQYQVMARVRPRSHGPRYTGPLVILIDELNISAAEYVAATLVDNGRALAFGATTSGAGGDQRTIRSDNTCRPGTSNPFDPCVPADIAVLLKEFGIGQISYTVTLGLRIDRAGKPLGQIENIGVAPHHPYELSATDLATGGTELRRTLLGILANL